MPKYKHGSGSVYKRGKTLWFSYYANGERVRESAHTADRAEARRLLQLRLGQVADGKFTGPAADRVTFAELAADFLTDYRINGKKSVSEAERRTRLHLRPFFTGKTAHGITTADVKAFIAKRQEAGASNGEINRELAALKRMFNLATQAEKIAKKPYIPMLEENNARQGFFEPWEFDAVLAKLPPYLRPPMMFAYITGWRRNEILHLTWPQIDFAAALVRLEVGTTKNKGARQFPFTDDLRAVLAPQWTEHRTDYPDCPWVFHRAGKRIATVTKAWRRACQAAGLVGRIPHDFRRTAVRNLIRAGVPERVAMMLTGHKTRAVFDRYHIVSEGDLRDAAQRLNQAVAAANSHNFSHTALLSREGSAVSH